MHVDLKPRQCIRALLERGALLLPNNAGCTPLHIASAAADAVVRVLMLLR